MDAQVTKRRKFKVGNEIVSVIVTNKHGGLSFIRGPIVELRPEGMLVMDRSGGWHGHTRFVAREAAMHYNEFMDLYREREFRKGSVGVVVTGNLDNRGRRVNLERREGYVMKEYGTDAVELITPEGVDRFKQCEVLVYEPR